MNYINAINKVLEHEGGYVNHPADRGGPTNFGITQKVYEAFKGRKVSIEEMRKMPKSDAIAIYKKEYWDKIGGDKIKFYSVAFAIFDQAVNRGVSAAVRQAQRISGTIQDGIVGPNTLLAINTMSEREFLNRYLTAAESAYRSIASSNTSQGVFLNGWLNRVESLKEYSLKNMGTIQTVTASIGAVIVVAGIFFLIYLSNSKSKA